MNLFPCLPKQMFEVREYTVDMSFVRIYFAFTLNKGNVSNQCAVIIYERFFFPSDLSFSSVWFGGISWKSLCSIEIDSQNLGCLLPEKLPP